MKEIYLHIGYPKTGTSSIQVFLRRNGDALRRQGFYVPETGQGVTGAHHVLARALVGLPIPPRQAVSAAEVTEEIRKAEDRAVLISSENLTGIFADNVQAAALLSKLRPLSTRFVVIMYVRNQPQWINSAYSQAVKSMRRDIDFDDYVERVCVDIRSCHYDKWTGIAQKLGIEMIIRPYSKEIRERGVVQDYLATVGINMSDDLTIPERINEATGPFTVELARRLFRLIPGGLDNLTLRQSNRIARIVQGLGIPDGTYCGLDTEQAASIEAVFADANDRFANRVWGISWEAAFRDDLRQEFVANDYRKTKVTAEKEDLLDELLAKLWPEVSTILTNPGLSVRVDWNERHFYDWH